MAGRGARVNTQALLQQANAAYEAGDHRGSLALYNKAGAASGKSAEALIGAANAYLALSQTPDARRACQKALQLRPDSAEVLCLMARTELLSGNRERGLEVIDKALTLAPGLTYALQIKAELLRLEGRKREAYELLKETVEGGESHPGVAIGYAELAAEFDGPDACVTIAKKILQTPGLRPMMRSNILFRVGSALDRAEDYDRAFDYAAKANRIMGTGWDMRASEALLQERFDASSPETLAAMPRSKVRSPLPLFVMGMPRSGTSLTEQILACHSKVYGAGELGDIPRITRELLDAAPADAEMQERMTAIPRHMLDARAQTQLKKLMSLSGGASYVVDKRPHNFLFLPEIASLFPGGRVVICKRHPLDNLLSCFLTNLGPHHGWSSDLIAMGRYYAQADRLMEHYARHVDLPIMTLAYQDMIDDHEATVRRVVEHMGLEWEDACLQHDKSSRVVMTASAEQATKPIYRSSLARWRHYEKHLGPLIETLQSQGVDLPDV